MRHKIFSTCRCIALVASFPLLLLFQRHCLHVLSLHPTPICPAPQLLLLSSHEELRFSEPPPWNLNPPSRNSISLCWPFST